jgi:signal transduction histidine kinase
MHYTIDKIRAYRKHVNTLEKIISIPAKVAVLTGGILAIYPVRRLIGPAAGEGADSAHFFEDSVPFFGTITALRTTACSILAYFLVTVVMWALLFLWKKSRESMWITKGLLIGIFVADLYYLSLWLCIDIYSKPLESNLFWLYCLLVVRNVIYFPGVMAQVVLALSVMSCYAGTYVIWIWRGSVSEGLGGVMGTIDSNALVLRIIILMLVNLSAWGFYAIYQRRIEAEDEMQERTIRSERLGLAGLVAKQTAHSLKNPLAIINNACYLLGRELAGGQRNVKDHIEIIKNQVDRADGIISELTKYSELASGRIEKADVNREVRRCISDLEYEIEKREIVVVEELTEALPALMIEESQLRQVLSNILLNACEALGKGGSIWVRTEMQVDGRIKIVIEDNGKGIAEGDLENVFKANFTTKEGGSGIGLSIVHTIVQAYNGVIDVESEVGKGARFTVVFPTRTERVE